MSAHHADTRCYPNRPIVGVGGVLLVENKVVLIKRRYEPLASQWSLPGGTLELGESLEVGTARELFEETGLEVEVGPILDTFDRIMPDEEQRVKYHFVLIDYLCWPVGGKLEAGSEVADIALVDWNGLSSYGLTQKATEVIKRGFEEGRTLKSHG